MNFYILNQQKKFILLKLILIKLFFNFFPSVTNDPFCGHVDNETCCSQDMEKEMVKKNKDMFQNYLKNILQPYELAMRKSLNSLKCKYNAYKY